MTIIAKLGLGVNLMGYTGDVDMIPGEALMAIDVLPRIKGDVMSHWGYTKHNSTSLTGFCIWHKGFAHKGKNSGAADIRTGNYGADTGAIFTRRTAWYASQLILMSDGTAARWDHATQDYIAVALPAGVTALADPHPSGFVAQNCLYISGFADANLRYDPTDELLYVIGWPDVPVFAPILLATGGGSDLVVGATYQYAASWIDLYTGEQSGLSDPEALVPTVANQRVDLQFTPNYGAGLNERHFYDNANPEESDVGIVIYRTEANKGQFNFLGMVYPSVPATYDELANATEWTDGTALVDNGLATDASRPASTRTYFDPPLMDAWVYHKKMWWGLAWGQEARDVSEWATGKETPDVRNPNRVYNNDFSNVKSQLERWKPKDYTVIATGEGDVLTCIATGGKQDPLTIFSTETAYELVIKPNFSTGSMQAIPGPLDYTVGAVGPRAWVYQGGYIHWLSRRGPYRATPGGIPQWIGKNLSPMFIDPQSGMCQLNPAAAIRSQVTYDQDADMIRFVCPVGVSTVMNRHFGQWTLGEAEGQDPYHGWFFFSPRAQWLDYTHAMGAIDAETGAPENQFVRDARMVFSDEFENEAWGFVNQYEVSARRAGLENGLIATGICDAASTVNLIATDAALFNDGDGLWPLRLEVVHTDGTIDITRVDTNGLNTIVPLDAFSQEPDGARFYVGGVPAYWLGWVDHDGDPHAHKDLTHIFFTFNKQTTDPDTVIDITVATANDFPGTFTVRRTINANRNTHKKLIARTGRFWQYEMSCSRPDERFCLSSIKREFVITSERAR